MRGLRTGLLVLSTLVMAGMLASGAAATSCIAAPGVRATITGSGDTGMGGKFFEQYDVAILGEVATVKNNPRVPVAGTTITVDVYGAIGTPSVGDTVVVTADDHGAMNGFPFQRGDSYFIPLKNKGPQGQVNYSFLCDPIAEIGGPGAADKLLALARSNGLSTAVPGNDAEAEPAAGPVDGDSPGPAAGLAWPWVAGSATAAALLAGAVLLRRRRPA